MVPVQHGTDYAGLDERAVDAPARRALARRRCGRRLVGCLHRVPRVVRRGRCGHRAPRSPRCVAHRRPRRGPALRGQPQRRGQRAPRHGELHRRGPPGGRVAHAPGALARVDAVALGRARGPRVSLPARRRGAARRAGALRPVARPSRGERARPMGRGRRAGPRDRRAVLWLSTRGDGPLAPRVGHLARAPLASHRAAPGAPVGAHAAHHQAARAVPARHRGRRVAPPARRGAHAGARRPRARHRRDALHAHLRGGGGARGAVLPALVSRVLRARRRRPRRRAGVGARGSLAPGRR